MNRVVLKITGAQGQGVNSVGEMCAKGLKRAGYSVFGYREYMSLIKGGHSSYQLDIAPLPIHSSRTTCDVLVCFNHHGLELNVDDVAQGGIILHQSPDWQWSAADKKKLRDRNVSSVCLPTDEVLARIKARPRLANVLITSVVWALLGRKEEAMKALVKEQFGHKKEVLPMNLLCVEEGFAFRKSHADIRDVQLPMCSTARKDDLLVTGSQAMGMGLIHAGMRLYVGYPMTPSSPLLSYVAGIQNETNIVVKQAEDEITAVGMMLGANHMGTRAATATSGGGFDLMTETVSLAGMIESPGLIVLAQRPGPATGLPTWTAQGDLLLACFAAHGEFPRLVLSVSDAQDSFALCMEAFNQAERWQIPVVLLTDKQTAEALYTAEPFDEKSTKMDRGMLVTESKKLAKLKATDRYAMSKNGVTPRWLPGSKAATYCAQGDEHNEDGSVDETAENAVQQMEKRMRKLDALKKSLPEPELFVVEQGRWKLEKSTPKLDGLIVGWGSSKGPIMDAAAQLSLRSKKKLKIGYLHYTYLWPLRTEKFAALHAKAKQSALVEGNFQGQLGMLLQQQCGVHLKDRILRYDGRPFFCDELLSEFSSRFVS